MTLEDIMAQLQHIDAHLNTLNDELCQVNTLVGHIAWHRVVMGGFVASPSPTLEASEDDDDDDDDVTTSNDEDDGNASSSSADEMSTWPSYPLSLMTKRRSNFDYESSHS